VVLLEKGGESFPGRPRLKEWAKFIVTISEGERAAPGCPEVEKRGGRSFDAVSSTGGKRSRGKEWAACRPTGTSSLIPSNESTA